MRKFKVIIVALALGVTIFGQAKPDPIYRLNPEASATWTRITQAEAVENDRHQKEVDRLNELRAVMLQAAGIPKEAWAHCMPPDSQGIVACAKPETAKTEKK